MKKLMIAMFLSAMMLGGCVESSTAVEYAARAHPECTDHRKVNHSSGGQSQTEVSMKCKDPDGKHFVKSITIKCNFGWGIMSDTTCHENN